MRGRRRAHNKLDWAVQWGTVRMLGTFLTDSGPVDVPEVVLRYASEQLVHVRGELAAAAGPGPAVCYLVIEGLGQGDPGKLIRLRRRIHAAARSAAEGRQTTYDATASAISIGIRGPDAAERISQLRSALAHLIARNGWTVREQPGLP